MQIRCAEALCNRCVLTTVDKDNLRQKQEGKMEKPQEKQRKHKKKREVLKGNTPKNVLKRVIIANFKTGACYIDWKVNDYEKYMTLVPLNQNLALPSFSLPATSTFLSNATSNHVLAKLNSGSFNGINTSSIVLDFSKDMTSDSPATNTQTESSSKALLKTPLKDTPQSLGTPLTNDTPNTENNTADSNSAAITSDTSSIIDNYATDLSSKRSSILSVDDLKTTDDSPKILNGWEGPQDPEISAIIKVMLQVGSELKAGLLKKVILEPIQESADDFDESEAHVNNDKFSTSVGNNNTNMHGSSKSTLVGNFGATPPRRNIFDNNKKNLAVSSIRRDKNMPNPNSSSPMRSNIFKRTGSVSNDDMDFLSSSLSSSLQSPCVTSGTFSFLSHKLRDAGGVMKKNKSSMIKNFFYSTKKHKIEKNKTLFLSSYVDPAKRFFGGVFYENNDEYKEKANEFIEKIVKLFMEKRICPNGLVGVTAPDMIFEISDLMKGGSGMSAVDPEKQTKLLLTFQNFDIEIIKLIEEIDFNLKKKENS